MFQGCYIPQGSVDWLISFTAIDWEALLTAAYWLCLSAVSYFPNINQIVTEPEKQTESHSHFFSVNYFFHLILFAHHLIVFLRKNVTTWSDNCSLIFLKLVKTVNICVQ